MTIEPYFITMIPKNPTAVVDQNYIYAAASATLPFAATTNDQPVYAPCL